jgi:hypothetical protein
MTTLDTRAGTTSQATETQSAPAPAAEKPADTAALITEQRVLLSSAAALAPAPARPHFWSRAAHAVAAPVHAMLTRPEKQSRPPKHYPQRFAYLESSAMSRAMDRL